MRPLLLIDIDGVLNAEPLDDTVVPDGMRRVMAGSTPVLVDERLPRWMWALRARYDCVWASSWERDADRLFAPAAGIDPLGAYVPLDGLVVRAGECWKRDPVAAYLAEQARPAIWLDDEFGSLDNAWARARRPELEIIRCNPRTGVRAEQIAYLLS